MDHPIAIRLILHWEGSTHLSKNASTRCSAAPSIITIAPIKTQLPLHNFFAPSLFYTGSVPYGADHPYFSLENMSLHFISQMDQ